MTTTSTKMLRAGALCTAVAGAIFIGVQIHHPPMTVASVTTTDWFVRQTAKAVMAILVLVGITALYVRQRREVGRFGLVGYSVFSVAYLLMLVTEIIGAFVLPGMAHSSPTYVNNVLVASFGGTPTHSIGGLQALFDLAGITFIAGGVLFGVALFRARILSRWAAALLAVGAAATMTLKFLPQSFNRPMAVPIGIALIGLGVSLWLDQRNPVAEVAPATSRLASAVVA